MKYRTELVRMNSKTKKRLQKAYPNVTMPELIDIAFKTSPLRLETGLREFDKKLDRAYGRKKKTK